METIIEKIERLRAELNALPPLSKEQQARLDKKFRLEFNFNSNHIEGNTLTYGETELLLIFDQTKGDHTHREYEEMKAHDVCYALIQQWATDERLISESDIKNLNKTLLVRPYWKEAITPDGQDTRRQISVGEYKKHPNSVRLQNGEMFEYASPIETPAEMEGLMQWYHEQEAQAEAHPLLLAALLHYKFVRIHPFDDGNGRVSRLLMNYVLLRHSLPPVIVKSANKPAYLRALNQADAGDTAAFVRYIGEQLVWSLELCLKAARGESLEEPNDVDKELALLQKQLVGQTKPLNAAKSPEMVAFAFKNGLIELFQLLERKFQPLIPSFLEGKRDFIHMPVPVRREFKVLVVRQNDADWDTLRSWAKNEIFGRSKNVSQFTFNYRLGGLKSKLEAPSFDANINIVFNDYNFTINGQSYPYGQPLTEEKMLEIVNPIIKDIIERIKQATSAE